MYTLLVNGKTIVGTMETLESAMAAAKIESLVDGGVTYKGAKGRSVVVWSGDLSPMREGGVTLRGVTQHAIWICGFLSK